MLKMDTYDGCLMFHDYIEDDYKEIPSNRHTLYEDYRDDFIDKYKYIDNRFNKEIIEEYHDVLSYNQPFDEVCNTNNETYRIALTSLIKDELITKVNSRE